MPRFQPPHCPWDACPSRTDSVPFRFQKRGFYCGRQQRRIQRFWCHGCRRSFSSQSFKFHYRLKYGRLHLDFWPLVVSKVTLRQSARMLGVDRRTLADRLFRMGEHARRFHRLRLQEVAARGGLPGVFQLDELETFETDRRLQPVTVPVLIHRAKYFVVHLTAGTLPCRGSLPPRLRKKKEEREKLFGKRRSQSRQGVEACLQTLKEVLPPKLPAVLQSDRKKIYPSVLKSVFGAAGFQHLQECSKRKRDRGNPLFPINHTLAQMRDNLSRLVRRNWAHSKKRSWLRLHMWLWLLWRNYVRPITAEGEPPTPGMLLGVTSKRWTAKELFRWRIFSPSDLPDLQ
ncbi:MAG: IS1 family transposase [Planctomycetota bacterium]|nr:MAG: IS1 family transposase [Planctomycetota bacterium]